MEGGRERGRKGEAPIVCARRKGRRGLLGSSLSEDLTFTNNCLWLYCSFTVRLSKHGT